MSPSSPDPTLPETDDGNGRTGATVRTVRRPHRTRRRLVLSCGAVLAAAAVGVAVWSSHPPTSVDAERVPSAAATARVTSGAMVEQTNVMGTLQYASSSPIVAGSPGTVTDLPAPGATITAGQVLYRIDTRPMVLLSGSMPAWRDFAAGMSDGDDVRQLEENLRALGFFDGEPDAHFGWGTAAAIRSWQKSLGVDQTGSLSKSGVVFSTHALRVNDLESRVGAQVGEGAPLFQASAEEQVVSLDLSSADRALAAVGAGVAIILPDGGEIGGTVGSIGAPTQKPGPDGAGTRVVLPVTIDLADQSKVADLALSSVTVRFSSPLRDDVLTVPVEALVPMDDTTFAVELPSRGDDGARRLLPVTVGAFSSGNVEISGDGIVAGVNVVVPTR